MANRLSLDALAPVMADMLQSGREVSFSPEGDSMLPLLSPGRCKVVLTRLDTPPRKHDILFYRRENGIFLLHRVVSVEANGYTMCGDNQYVLETGLKPQNIIGLVKGFYQDGVYNGLNAPGYRLYCRTLWARRGWLKLRARVVGKCRQWTKKIAFRPQKGGAPMPGKTNCECCNNYVYDDEYDCYYCDMNLDEDEMVRFLTGGYADCPYYVSGDEYEIVRKQN